jgi:hypothetical protein
MVVDTLFKILIWAVVLVVVVMLHRHPLVWIALACFLLIYWRNSRNAAVTRVIDPAEDRKDPPEARP